jgi:hypothetical protein
MKQASMIATDLASHQTVLDRRKSAKGIFTIVLEALHRSRRLQAERTLGKYRHLIDKTRQQIHPRG